MRYKLKIKPGFYCKLFNNYRYDNKCNEMSCEFCDPYYDPKRKVWWKYKKTNHLFLGTYKDVEDIIDDCIFMDDQIKTRIVNIKTHTYDAYIGRRSSFGNPYIIGKDGDRDTVIAKYQKYFYGNEELKKLSVKLKGLRLGCYCFPENCHGDVIAEYIENL